MEPSQPHPPSDLAPEERAAPGAAPKSTRTSARVGLDARLGRWALRAVVGVRRALARSSETADPFMVSAGLLGLIGQPVFYVIWRYVFPQPYENLPVRLIGAALCVPLVLKDRWPERLLPLRPLVWVLAVFYNLPFLYSIFLLHNELSQVWLLSMIGGVFVLTFMVELATAVVLFVAGTLAAYGLYMLQGGAQLAGAELLRADYLQYLVVVLFPLVFGGITNFQLQRYRHLQRNFERRLRNITTQHARVVQEQNSLLSRFLSNVIVSRLRRFQTQHGLAEAITMITRQETRFCGIMQADVRNFTKMFGRESEIEVAQQIRRCFTEITEIGQDLAVLKPVGDCIFVYTDDEHGRQNAVFNVLALAIFFVHSLERVNRTLVGSHADALNFGIGLHAGEVIYGNLASDTLIDPTIIGINVNKAARLEELTKAPAVQDLVGTNAIIMSDELAFYGSNFVLPKHLITLPLKELGLILRDFPQVERVYALRSEIATSYVQKAEEHIRAQRARFATGASHMEANSHHGVTYYYEMQGLGPNTSWLALIDVSALPARTVNHYALHALPDLECELNQGDGQWLVVSTRNSPGEYDEVELEGRIVQIIEGLEQAAAQPGPQ